MFETFSHFKSRSILKPSSTRKIERKNRTYEELTHLVSVRTVNTMKNQIIDKKDVTNPQQF